ncbi:MAG: toxic anion resistance protein [Lachnospiraceae bacterium]|nr:toxic anion resistance protein [Lachnospiraceae bacterium]
MANENDILKEVETLNSELQQGAFAFEAAPEAPTLSFGDPAPVQEERKEVLKDIKVDDSMLSDSEKQQVESFAKQIDLADTNAIIQYGAGTQKKMADFSDAALENVKTRDLGEVGDMLGSVIVTLKDVDPDAEEGGFFHSLFKKPEKRMTEMKAKYDKASSNVEKVVAALEKHKLVLMKDVAIMDKMYATNLAYYKELTMYILAGKKKLEMAINEELPAAKAKAQASGLAEDAQAARDMEDQITRFEKKLYDLELTRMVSIQTAPQIRMIQSNDTMMVEKINSTLVNTIPLWKNQMLITMGLEDSTRAAKAEAEVNAMTNKLLQSNADKLKQATIETAQASERGIVDMETLRHTNETLISTLDEVARIQNEGREKRAQAEVELRNMENELKNKLLTMRQNLT